MKKVIYVNDQGDRRSIYPIDIPSAIEDGFRPEGDGSPALPTDGSSPADIGAAAAEAAAAAAALEEAAAAEAAAAEAAAAEAAALAEAEAEAEAEAKAAADAAADTGKKGKK